jgi:hypothetical protein
MMDAFKVTKHIRSALLLFTCLTCTTKSGAAADDPTFSHTFGTLQCVLDRKTFCGGEFCADFTTQQGTNYWISTERRLIDRDQRFDESTSQKLHFTNISAAGENKVLYDKFEFEFRGALKKGMLVFFPMGSTFDIRLAIDTFVPETVTQAFEQKWNGLTIDRWIESGTCTPVEGGSPK